MSPLNLTRLSGLAGILGGALWIALRLLIATTADAPVLGLSNDLAYKLLAAPLLLLLVSLIGLYARQARQLTWLGRTGFGIALIGITLLFFSNIAGLWLGSMDGLFIFFFWAPLILGGGLIVFAIATMRAGVFAPWSSTLLLMVGFLGALQFFVAGVGSLIVGAIPGLVLWGLFGLGWIVLGSILWSRRSDSSRREQPVGTHAS